ncbi:TetR/AcrR family transcriptional regulator [Flavobacterium hydatis]|jgi:AcrR family transcriptional regulator|uniref:TetR family transcriptional regulator n=1 Tax=Flavobacterium hydatis TaxID=991 RepID=A0A086AGI6_FLAHY|nr:TetR/AcrR family transcriptional regulator [Flavobacterium hydatis]KFF15800.1 TetR family transcriptional regulator [Flavobacterium hydatis]OXA85968.1 TetR family transcriptional regulator [Flavobacterium hydatis]
MASKSKDASTEEKIKEAARIVFTQKGYSATRTRDIAEEAGINLALLNYYFRSKEKLFELVMAEKVGELFGVIAPIVNNEKTSLDEKVILIVDAYITMLSQNPGLPLFVLSEIRNNPEHFGNRMQGGRLLTESFFVKQLVEKKADIHPLHFVVNILSMSIFPFIAKPVLESAGVMTVNELRDFTEERKILIVKWFKAMIDS